MIEVRRYRRSDARAVSALISRTYASFNAEEGTPEGVRAYVERFRVSGKTTEEINERFARTPVFFVAMDGSEPIGLVRGRDSHLVNLYVDGGHHREGIATYLFSRFEEVCCRAGYSEITVRSSLFAVPFYTRMGFKKTTGIRTMHGLKVQPMKKRLSLYLGRRNPSDSRLMNVSPSPYGTTN